MFLAWVWYRSGTFQAFHLIHRSRLQQEQQMFLLAPSDLHLRLFSSLLMHPSSVLVLCVNLGFMSRSRRASLPDL